jgi:hypothetical protein
MSIYMYEYVLTFLRSHICMYEYLLVLEKGGEEG